MVQTAQTNFSQTLFSLLTLKNWNADSVDSTNIRLFVRPLIIELQCLIFQNKTYTLLSADYPVIKSFAQTKLNYPHLSF